MEKELLLFQLGPVQEFIAQSATPEDLWAGSYLLARVTLSGIDALGKCSDLIFPNLLDGTVRGAMEGPDRIPTIPNRFLAEVDASSARDVASKVENAVRAELVALASEAKLPEGASTQVEQFLTTSWAVLPHNRRTWDMREDYAAISSLLSARRNLRNFQPWRETVDLGPKDFLSGKETALDAKKKRGALNLIKLALPKIMKKRVEIHYPDDDKYIAVVAMDGDTMGKRLSEFKEKKDHLAFSANLVRFAQRAIEVVRENGGSPIYVGGDDVLAVFPAKRAVKGARALYDAFVQIVGGTASAGLAVGHEKAPMQELVTHAHAAEHRAKHVYGRDALVVDAYKRSGETVSWGGKWASKGVDALIEFRDLLKGELFRRFPYKLMALLGPYQLERLGADGSAQFADVIAAEYAHAWNQCTGSEVEDEALLLVTGYFAEVVKGTAKAVDFLNVFRCETFVNRPRDIEEEVEG